MAWAAISYHSIAELAYVWHGPVGVGFVAAICLYEVLVGPPWIMMTILNWLIAATMLGGLIYLAVNLYNADA